MSSLIKTSLIYVISAAVNAGVPIVLLPILTRNLTPDEYGRVAIFQTVVNFLTSIVGLNVPAAINRKSYDLKEGGGELGAYVHAAGQILIFTFLPVLLLLLIFGAQISKYFDLPFVWLYFALVIAAFAFFQNICLTLWQTKSKAIQFGIMQVANGLFALLASLLLVLLFRRADAGRVEAITAASCVFGLLSIFILYKNGFLIALPGNFRRIKELIRFGVPLMPHIVGLFLLSSVDKWVIKDRIGLSDVGEYQVAMQISFVVSIVFDSVNRAYVPWLFHRLEKNSVLEREFLVSFTYKCLSLMVIVMLILYYALPAVVHHFVGDHYPKVPGLVGILVVAQVFSGMYLLLINYLYYEKKTLVISVMTIFLGLFGVLAMYMSATHYGVMGVAVSFLGVSVLRFVFAWLLANYYHPMPWFFGKRTLS